jgi:hypothetical protein
MAKATIKLSDGTCVTVEGTPEEVQRLLEIYSAPAPPVSAPSQLKQKSKRKSVRRAEPTTKVGDQSPDLNEIVGLVKSCDEAAEIEERILDRTSMVDRTLLPLYIVHEHLDNAFGLTSGDVRKVTTDLGIPVATPNASRTLSGTASRYVIVDRLRKRGGAPPRYKLSRRGVQYMKAVIAGKAE